jgi:sulfur carrier protein
MIAAPETIHVYVNGADRIVAGGAGLASLLEEMALGSRSGLAVAVNDEVVPRTLWAACRLQAGDRVLVIQASQGG